MSRTIPTTLTFDTRKVMRLAQANNNSFVVGSQTGELTILHKAFRPRTAHDIPSAFIVRTATLKRGDAVVLWAFNNGSLFHIPFSKSVTGVTVFSIDAPGGVHVAVGTDRRSPAAFEEYIKSVGVKLT